MLAPSVLTISHNALLPALQNPQCVAAWSEDQKEYYNKDTAIYMGFAFIYRDAATHEIKTRYYGVWSNDKGRDMRRRLKPLEVITLSSTSSHTGSFSRSAAAIGFGGGW
jgi:hypothetical protein